MSETIDSSTLASTSTEQNTSPVHGENLNEVGATGTISSENPVGGGETVPTEEGPVRDPRYPLTVAYCTVCTLPAELHEYHSNSQFEKYVALERFVKTLATRSYLVKKPVAISNKISRSRITIL